jgi:diguanylate cyclase (GGDEF)-like protein/PAS domain S-box-containing protein
MNPPEESKTRKFISLKWWMMVIFSFVLIIVNTGLAGLGYYQLREQFNRHQLQVRHQQVEELEGLVSNSFTELEMIASLIPNLANPPVGKQSLQQRVENLFTQQAASFEFDWGISEASFYSNEGKLVFNWQPIRNMERIRPLIEEVNATESPDFELDCSKQCRQYIAVPVLEKGQKQGVLLLGRQISDIIISFRNLTGADIGIISTVDLDERGKVAPRYLREWEHHVVALTRPEINMPLLLEASRQFPLEKFISHRQWINSDDKIFSLNTAMISGSESDIPTQFLIINDISRAVNHINTATRNNLVFGLLGFVASESLLLLLLWSPLKRLEILSTNLPLLAENAFGKVRKNLYFLEKGWYRDEIDTVGETTFKLSHTLESMHHEIQIKTFRLLQRGEELTQERDFVTELLKSAQVIILTQNVEGLILTLNPEGRKYLYEGKRLPEPTGLIFSELFKQESKQNQFSTSMERLISGQINTYRHDSVISCYDEAKRSISWVHSRLSQTPDQSGPGILSVGLDITEREEAEKRLAWLANHDPLTELYNRRHFQNGFQEILDRAARYHHNVALLFFDLDQFKYINDTSGHQAGDAMLRVVAEHLSQLTRSSDLLARLGGDEFAVVIPETDINGAIHLSDKILDHLKDISLPSKGRSHRVSASIGIVMYPEHGTTLQDLMANADLSMYQAKESGRDRWHLFALNDHMREQMNNRVTWKDKIENALANSDFLLYYQPILEIRSGRISHYEVLIRMREEDGSIAMPGDFIPVAERTGLIHSIDRFVLREAINRLSILPESLKHEINLSINLSGKVVDDPELLPLLKQLLNLSGVNPRQLVFELTETATLADTTSAEKLMRELQTLGCRFAMDDFGVGFSSFYYLRELPLDIVKIDGSFIRKLPSSKEDQIFVKALTEMARGLKKRTIAEFVEDRETLKLLVDLGVDYAQGYHIGKPSPEINTNHNTVIAANK